MNGGISLSIEAKPIQKRSHNVILDNRRKLMISGVCDVDSFDEQQIILKTDMGEMTIRGSQLHVDKLSVETGDVAVSGTVHGMVYTDDKTKEGGFFARLFK